MIIILFLTSLFSNAENLQWKVTELPVPQSTLDQYSLEFANHQPTNVIDDIEIIFDQVVNVGEKFWGLISRGIHAPSVTSARAHALPKGLSRDQVFFVLPSWKGPAVRRQRLELKSDLISDRWVAKLTYDVVAFYAGGRQGDYLLDVHVKPVGEANVRFSWSLDVDVEINEPLNMSESNEQPLAAMQVNVKYEAKAPHDHRSGVHSYLVKGNGDIDPF